jgi:hypothetical protein
MRPLLLAIILFAPVLTQAQSAADTEAVRQVALDYIEGWYSGDSERMERALHPDLVKRIVETRDGRRTISEMSAVQLIGSTANGGGLQTPADVRRTDVTVLDVFGNSASVRIDAHTWIDYLHVARFDGQWKIVNVLWELR